MNIYSQPIETPMYLKMRAHTPMKTAYPKMKMCLEDVNLIPRATPAVTYDAQRICFSVGRGLMYVLLWSQLRS